MTESTEMKSVKTVDIAARFFVSAEKYGDRPAMGMSGDDAYLTYGQLAEKVRECAVILGKVEPGEPIGLLLENRPAWCKAYLAILARGGVVVPVDSLLKPDELSRVFVESGIKRILVSQKFLDVAEEVNNALDSKIEIINMQALPPADTTDFEPHFNENPDSQAVLIFTSGTTSKSKKVILTHKNILSDIDGINRRLKIYPEDRFLSVLPLHHTFEATVGFLLPMSNGCAVYYVKALNSREILGGIKKHQVTIFVSVPLLYEKLYHGILNGVKKAPASRRAMFKVSMSIAKSIYSMVGVSPGKKLFAHLREKAGMQSIRLLVSGGAPLPVEICKSFYLLGFDFLEGYGLTETSPVLTVNLPEKSKFGSVGTPLDNVKIKIDQPNDKGVGEVLAQGPMITPGYQDNPEETAKLLRDGWLYTGDLGLIDEDGYLHIMGRQKNLIVSAAGKNIYPEEIETQLIGSPFIMEAMIWGKEAANGREEVAAMIYPDFDALAEHLGKSAEDITDDEIKATIDPEIKAICGRMADFKRIKHIAYLREELEKTSSKKIKRYKYKQ